jgi:hypothetical protein
MIESMIKKNKSMIESMIESLKREKGIELNPNHSLKQSPMRLKPHERESRNRIEFEIVPETKVHEPQAKAP